MRECEYCGKQIRGEVSVYRDPDGVRWYFHKRCHQRLKKLAKEKGCAIVNLL